MCVCVVFFAAHLHIVCLSVAKTVDQHVCKVSVIENASFSLYQCQIHFNHDATPTKLFSQIQMDRHHNSNTKQLVHFYYYTTKTYASVDCVEQNVRK